MRVLTSFLMLPLLLVVCDAQRQCRSLQRNIEVMNFKNGWILPPTCLAYFTKYVNGGQYKRDMISTVALSRDYARSVKLKGDGLDVWFLDVDDIALSNIPYYVSKSFGSTAYNQTDFDLWVEQGKARAVAPVLAFYKELIASKWKVIFRTKRPERQRSVTVKNLLAAGYKGWTALVMTRYLHFVFTALWNQFTTLQYFVTGSGDHQFRSELFGFREQGSLEGPTSQSIPNEGPPRYVGPNGGNNGN